ncbi:MAG TPA: DUF192 domain-containing protein [Methanobacteriaceae archaeon]|nr:DUF192 domain-containing protein [Methanobacteriaceae archaeon]
MTLKTSLINKSKNKSLGNVEFADSFFSRFRGLMLKKDIKSGLVLKIPAGRGKRGSAIHMFFMRIPLDIIFADADLKVVDMVSLDPWKTYTPQHPARFVVELQKGLLKESETEIGDIIEFNEH